MRRLIGLDPGLRATGWGVIEVEGSRLRHVANGVVRVDTEGEMAARLRQLFDALMLVLEEAVPFPAEINAAVFDQMQASYKWMRGLSPQAQVASIDYRGDLAGIHCMLALEGAPPSQDIFVSLTQLNLDPRLPYFGQVRAYQQTRRETLRQRGMLSDRVLEFG